jgi:extracellular factor (EF) 3-hydroxypalmitic acid methyl ester biosynthesis protein
MDASAFRKTFRQLTDADIDALAAVAVRRAFDRDATIIEPGQQHPGILVVASGFADVQRAEGAQRIIVAQLGPGEILGDMSFVEKRGATERVVAASDVTVDVVSEEALETLLTSDSGFSVRFYRSLALILTSRLRETTQRLATLSDLEIVRLDQLHAPQIGNVTDRQFPAGLAQGLRAFDDAMRALEAQCREHGPNAEVTERVGEACDAVVALTTEFTQAPALLEISVGDLLAFRDTPDIGRGLGSRILRATYSFLMASATVARCYMRPRGAADDYETMEAIYRNEPEGDNWLGPLVDRWFLARPLCASRRHLCAMVTRRLRQSLADGDGQRPMTGLATGSAREALDLLAQGIDGQPLITCIDLDRQALLANAVRAEELGCTSRVRLARADVQQLVRGHAPLSLPPQHVVWTVGLTEYLGDDEVIRLLDWAHSQLMPGGALLVTNLHAANPDRPFLEQVLDWHLVHRTEPQLRDLFARSPFGGDGLRIDLDPTGTNMLAEAVKG